MGSEEMGVSTGWEGSGKGKLTGLFESGEGEPPGLATVPRKRMVLVAWSRMAKRKG